MSRPGVSYWHDRLSRSRRPSYPRYRGHSEADVVVIGSGLAGAACAYAFASAGIKVIVLEAGRVGSGATMGAVGLIREDFDTSFQAAAANLGLRSARLVWQGMRRGSLDFAATLRRLGIRCDLAPEDLLTLAPRDPDAVKRFRRRVSSTA